MTLASGERSVAAVLEEAEPLQIPMVVDSGAWSTFTGKANVTLEEHTEAVLRLQERFPESRFVGLDVIGDGEASLRNFRYQWERGANVEPTFTFGESADYVRRVLEGYFGTWVNLGGLVRFQSRPNTHRAVAAWAAHVLREVPDGMKVHALGVTTPGINDLLAFDSVDSTYWKLPLLMSRVVSLFDPRKRRWCRLPAPSRRISPSKVGEAAAREKHLLWRQYGLTVSDYLALDTDRKLLELSARSQAAFAETYRKRHGSELISVCAALDRKDLPMLGHLNARSNP